MVKHKYIDRICIGAAVLAAMLTILLMFGEQLGIPKASANPGYVTRLFDDSRVHAIDIQIADWGAFIADAEGEEYVALRYIDDDPDSYPGIFEDARFKVSEADQKRVIEALKTLSTGEKLETAVNVDEVLRYFTVQVFVMNWDSYLGHTGHNYFLYEEDGVLSILPWDYNLAFGTYALGMTDPIKDPNILINYPINTPAEGRIMPLKTVGLKIPFARRKS